MTVFANADRAIIDERKLRDYVLNPDHPIGGHKARVILAATGLDRGDHRDLADQIRRGALANEAERIEPTPYGERFRVAMTISGPGGVRCASAPDGSTGGARMSRASPRSTRSPAADRARPGRFELLQVVYARHARPDLGVRRGECGTVVEVFDEPRRAYYVEFVNVDGATRAEGAFTPEELSVGPVPP